MNISLVGLCSALCSFDKMMENELGKYREKPRMEDTRERVWANERKRTSIWAHGNDMANINKNGEWILLKSWKWAVIDGLCMYVLKSIHLHRTGDGKLPRHGKSQLKMHSLFQSNQNSCIENRHIRFNNGRACEYAYEQCVWCVRRGVCNEFRCIRTTWKFPHKQFDLRFGRSSENGFCRFAKCFRHTFLINHNVSPAIFNRTRQTHEIGKNRRAPNNRHRTQTYTLIQAIFWALGLG